MYSALPWQQIYSKSMNNLGKCGIAQLEIGRQLLLALLALQRLLLGRRAHLDHAVLAKERGRGRIRREMSRILALRF